MKTAFGAAMTAATTLTRQGRLNEATELIQRAFARAQAKDGWVSSVAKKSASFFDRPPAATTPFRTRADEAAAGRTFSYGSLVRGYELFVPPNPSRSPGLVVMLHGCTQDPADFARGTRVDAFASKHDCLVLYPAQSRSANAHGCWNWFEPDHQRRDLGEAGLIAHLTRHIVDEHDIDADRVFVAGLSAGGAMAAVMADTYPELFAAACIHSGIPAAAASNLPEALQAMRSGPGLLAGVAGRAGAHVPTIVFHGTQDRTVHPSNADAAVAAVLARSGEATTTVEVVELRDSKKRRVTKTSYRGANGRVVAEDWRVQAGAHAWFGGSSTGSYTDAAAIDATGEMMRFFAEHARDAVKS